MDSSFRAVLHEAGVTRLAELTGLDRVGFPVWQAVRPWSRALTVHQGKGLDDDRARRGAAMEALESHHAEQWLPATPPLVSSWDDLPPGLRSPAVDDFARRRGGVDPTARFGWVLLEKLGDSGQFFVPADCVSLDCTKLPHSGLARNSNGQAAHFARDAALTSGVLELIERDAVAAWLSRSAAIRGGYECDPATLDGAPFATIRGRLAECGINLRLYQLQAVVSVAAIVAEIADDRGGYSAHSRVWGSSAAFDPWDAVCAAVLEALQTRCSQIAGSRDTIPLQLQDKVPGWLGLPPRPGWRGHAFDPSRNAIGDLPALVAALLEAGYRQVGYLQLSPPGAAGVTVKAFVPGLGFEGRQRRVL